MNNAARTPAVEEHIARQVWTDPQYAFVAGAAGDERAKRANTDAWNSVRIEHQHPANVADRNLRAVLFGTAASAPIAIAPMGLPGTVHPDADRALAEAARAAGVPMVVSTFATSTIEDIAATGAETVFQLYWLRDQHKRSELIKRAENAGCTHLVITVDCPARTGSPREAAAGFEPTAPAMVDSTEIDPGLSWIDIEELAERTSMCIVVKGLLSCQAAQRAIETPGVTGLVVSNHGGRQLTTAAPTAQVLPNVVDEVRVSTSLAPVEVMVDSGITTGWDVLSALALGADGVLVGRQVLYGLASGGADGAYGVLTRLIDELDDAFSAAGVRSVEEARGLTAHVRAC